MKPTASIVEVTPRTAAQWLAKNQKNRNVRASVVDSYARDMAAGRWLLTGESVKFDTDGNLIDGQHRCMAVIKSDVTVSMLVVRGVQPEAQDVMDTGAKRSAGDALHLNGAKNANLVAAATRLLLQVEGGVRRGSTARAYTNSEISVFVSENPGVLSAAEAAMAVRSTVELTPSVTAATWFLLYRVDPERCAQFFTSIAESMTTGAGDPRNTLIRRLSSARRNGERLSQVAQMSFVIRAWNAWVKGERLSILKTHSSDGKGGRTESQIPKIAA